MDQGNAPQNRPRMILLGRMYQKTSQKTGEVYFRGTLGYPQTFLFKDKAAAEDNVWCLYAQERETTPAQPDSIKPESFSSRKPQEPKLPW